MITNPDSEPGIHDQVLVETRANDEALAFRAVVVNLQPAAIWLGLTRPDPALERLVSGQLVHLTFRRDAGALLADSTFRSHLGSSKNRLFAVERPSALQLVQRRAHLRHEIDRPVEMTVVSQSPSGSAGRTGSGRTRNVSAGGVHIATEMPLAVGDEVELTILFGPGEVVQAEAQVVRVDRADAGACPEPAEPVNSARSACVALRFGTISEVDQDKIVKHIFSMQRQRRDEAARKPAAG